MAFHFNIIGWGPNGSSPKHHSVSQQTVCPVPSLGYPTSAVRALRFRQRTSAAVRWGRPQSWPLFKKALHQLLDQRVEDENEPLLRGGPPSVNQAEGFFGGECLTASASGRRKRTPPTGGSAVRKSGRDLRRKMRFF